MRILETLFLNQVVNKQDHIGTIKHETMLKDFLLLKDDFGSTALHYAFYRHNFEFIDFIYSFLEANPASTILPQFEFLMCGCKDSSSQSAYSLFFWQIGRISYSKEAKENIKKYTLKYLTSVNKLEPVAKAYFPKVNIPNFKTEDSICGIFVNDYPRKDFENQEQISPLLYAISRQNFDMCKFMLKTLGFDPNVCDSNKISALVYAIRTNNLNLCKLLMNNDFETNVSDRNKPLQNGNQFGTAMKSGARMKSLFTGLITPAKFSERAKSKNPSSDDEESDDQSEDEENVEQENGLAENEFNYDVSNNTTATKTVFRIKSNLTLNNLDDKSRTIFHHLACSLEFGSFHNVEIAKLLFNAFELQQAQNKLPLLSEFLKRVDSKVCSI
jgi:ankyrin repeat protein